MTSNTSSFRGRYIPIIISILGATLSGVTSLQSPITTLYTNPTPEQKIAARISITGIAIHTLITACAYILTSPLDSGSGNGVSKTPTMSFPPLPPLPRQVTVDSVDLEKGKDTF